MSTIGNKEGMITWQCPSNIALVKYWGKHGRQMPNNCSISFTLKEAVTTTSISYRIKKDLSDGIDFTFRFDGEEQPAFAKKIGIFLNDILSYFPFLTQYHLAIESRNTFPHSAGIASSASAMGALALCLVQIEQKVFDLKISKEDFFRKASILARLGSGSASRSVFPIMAEWGYTNYLENATNDYATPCENIIHPIFHNFQDCILIADSAEKSVSSRAGHSLMENNPYAPIRYQEANDRFGKILEALKNGDIESFGELAEAEALTLHALMMASNPPYILMRPNTLKMIQLIQEYRKMRKVPLYFTLDAGPNIHLLYPEFIRTEIEQFIKSELVKYCENGSYILDKVGNGPIDLIHH